MNENENLTTTTNLESSQVVSEQPATVQSQPVAKPKSSKKILIPIFAGIGVLLILAVLAVVFFMKARDGKTIVRNTVGTFFDKALTYENGMDESFDLSKDIIRSKGSLAIDIDIESDDLDYQTKKQLEQLKNISVDYDVVTNFANKELSLKLGTSQNGKEILAAETFIKGNDLFIKSDVLGGTYRANLEESNPLDQIDVSNLKGVSVNDIKYLTSQTKKYVLESIKPEYIKQENGTFTVENKQLKGIKSTLVIDQTIANNMKKDVLTAIKNDSRYVEILSSLTGKKTTEILSEIDNEMTDSSSSSYSESTTLTLNVYTNAMGKMLGLELSNTDGLIVSAIKEGDITNYNIYATGKVVATLAHNEKVDEYTLRIEGDDAIVITVKVIDNGFNSTIKNNELSVDLGLVSTTNKGINNTKLDGSLTYQEDSAKASLKASLNTETKKEQAIDIFDTTSAKDIEKMTEYELDTVLDNIEKAIKGTYIEAISEIYNSMYSSYNYNYDYDYDYDYDYNYGYDY